MKRIPYSRQSINQDDIDAVVEVLKSDYLTTGPKVEEFEEAFARKVGAKYAVAVSSGTAGLHIAYNSIGAGRDDEIITSPITFVATANAAVYGDTHPIFCDIRESDANIDESQIENHISGNTQAIVPVHIAGQPCNMRAISEIGKKYDIPIIEDACHALGSYYGDNPVGACEYSDIAVFSLHPLKSITTGEGGVVTTNNRHRYETLKRCRNHGFSEEKNIHCVGFNYRMTDIQAALGISQLNRLESFISKRGNIAKIYDHAFKDCWNITTPFRPTNNISSNHLYIVRVNWDMIGKSRDQVMLELQEKGIETQVNYRPIYSYPYYVGVYGIEAKEYPNAEKHYKDCLSLPIHPEMNLDDIFRVIDAVVSLDG